MHSSAVFIAVRCNCKGRMIALLFFYIFLFKNIFMILNEYSVLSYLLSRKYLRVEEAIIELCLMVCSLMLIFA